MLFRSRAIQVDVDQPATGSAQQHPDVAGLSEQLLQAGLHVLTGQFLPLGDGRLLLAVEQRDGRGADVQESLGDVYLFATNLVMVARM